nr:cytochrome c3 family protein [Kofleriaceae bacterium]
MPALFARSSNTLYRLAIAGAVGTLTAAICAPMIYIRTAYGGDVGDQIEQPIAFDHRHHVRDDGIDCVYCHDTVETSEEAGLPSTERCMGCHGQVWPDSPELALLRANFATHQPVTWKRVTAVPAHVYFHHGVHVHAGVACEECHGQIEDMPRVARAYRLTMNFCVDCHRQRSGSRAIGRLTTCSTCHR